MWSFPVGPSEEPPPQPPLNDQLRETLYGPEPSQATHIFLTHRSHGMLNPCHFKPLRL